METNTMTDDRTSGNSREYRLGDEIPADTKAKIDELLEPFVRDYYEYCRYRMGVCKDAAWCVGVRVYANLVQVTRDVFGRITYLADPGYGSSLRVFGLPVWVTSGLGDHEIRLMVPAGTGAEEASRKPASGPMKCGFNVPAPDTPAPIVADAPEEVWRDFEAEVVRGMRRYLQLSEETWGRARETLLLGPPVVTYGGRYPDDPELPTAGPGAESWRDRPPLL